MRLRMLVDALLVSTPVVLGQVTFEELKPVFDGLAQKSQELAASEDPRLEARVPLSTDDPTVAPLVDLQVFAPPVVPQDGTWCEVVLLEHIFGDGSFGAPAVVPYSPPTDADCGERGKWAAISLNLTVYSIGTQYDRLGVIYLSQTEIWRTSSAEPTKTGTVWTTLKDVTHFTPLFEQDGTVKMDFSNIIDSSLLLDGVFNVTLTATFHAPTESFATPKTSDFIIPLSNLSPNLTNYFAVDTDAGGTTNVTLPETAIEAYVELLVSGNAAEEFWYQNAPDEFVDAFSTEAGIIGKGPFREVQILVDEKLAGVVWPYAVIYTGGITPSNWRPLTSYGAYDAPTYWIDITPFIPTLLTEDTVHNITLKVVGQGTNPTFNSNWFLSGSVHVRTGTSKTTGRITSYDVPDLNIDTVGNVSAKNATVWTKVTGSRSLNIEGELQTSEGTKKVKFSQSLTYVNEASYADGGWIQTTNQITIGTTISTHQGVQVLRDAFTYPLSVFSNYSLYDMQFGGYGSEINQTHTRALQPPTGPSHMIHSVQHAKGFIGMDDWPGLRHAINGTGATDQTFAYVDERGATYFRDVATKNDGWVRDNVWGTLRDANPPVPANQIFGDQGGPGFRRSVEPRLFRRGRP
ncbi:hypothetical protein D9758_007375 [Tetrapyrgos nigripes]|uniref:Peptide N-acetyl-beta-D-glucosaminyl asparaginase amidase A N-terminal domain-containing protein n=1 Tax=Tetrapyrgos nigripes TaxID=182062 RepID=A0A8H5GB14_9AGAR|nr:hypothetical protein D9758_007375 [Tetrapyrgos nigripes]